MRIGIVALDSQPDSSGGTNNYTCSLVDALADYMQRHTLVVITDELGADRWDYRAWPSHVRFATLRSVEPRQPVSVRMWRNLERMFRVSRSQHYGEPYLAQQIDDLDLDLAHFTRTVVYPMQVNTPVILTFFDLQHEYYPQFFTATELERRAQSYRLSVEKARHLVVPTRYTRQTLVETYDVAPDKMTLLPVGLRDSPWRADQKDAERVSVKYGLPDSFIFYPANPWPHKNHARLMAALRIYMDRYGEELWLVLSGRLQNEKRDAISLAIAAGVEGRVVDLGTVPREDLGALYKSARCLVFPSLFEGFGIPLIEAMACGCPVVAANASAIPEVAGNAALLFDPLDPVTIADAIYAVLHNRDLCTELVKRGYERVARFHWENIIPRLVNVYEQTR